MGMMIDGKWEENATGINVKDGQFLRKDSIFRRWVTADGSSGFKAEPGRYHLYVAHNCPWAHRTLLFRALKGLEDAITVSIAIPNDRAEGWIFGEYPGAIPDTVNGFTHLHQAYTASKPDYTGSITVPVLWDRKEGVIVNNESSEIIRMLNQAFAGIARSGHDFYPAPLREEIDRVNEVVYRAINNGVYRCGFAKSQEAYDEAFDLLFATIEEMETRLSRQRYLVGDRQTEADWRLFVTLLRFDPVYHGLFKCNLRRIAEYPNLSNYLRDLYQVPGVAETIDLRHIIRGYYSIRAANPAGIIPRGPAGYLQSLAAPHDRSRFGTSG
jgi:putative glutathione S-transferase